MPEIPRIGNAAADVEPKPSMDGVILTFRGGLIH